MGCVAVAALRERPSVAVIAEMAWSRVQHGRSEDESHHIAGRSRAGARDQGSD